MPLGGRWSRGEGQEEGTVQQELDRWGKRRRGGGGGRPGFFHPASQFFKNLDKIHVT